MQLGFDVAQQRSGLRNDGASFRRCGDWRTVLNAHRVRPVREQMVIVSTTSSGPRACILAAELSGFHGGGDGGLPREKAASAEPKGGDSRAACFSQRVRFAPRVQPLDVACAKRLAMSGSAKGSSRILARTPHVINEPIEVAPEARKQKRGRRHI